MRIELDKEKLAKAIESQQKEKRKVADACHAPSIAGSKSTDIFIDLPPADTLEENGKDSEDSDPD